MPECTSGGRMGGMSLMNSYTREGPVSWSVSIRSNLWRLGILITKRIASRDNDGIASLDEKIKEHLKNICAHIEEAQGLPINEDRTENIW